MTQKSSPLSLKLLQDDIDEVFNSLKPKSPTGTLTDQELALELWKAEVEAQEFALFDHELAVRMSKSPRADAALISSLLKEELAAQADRRLALSLDENATRTNQLPRPVDIKSAQQTVDMILAQDTGPVWGGKPSDFFKEQNGDTDKEKRIECIVCMEPVIYFNAVCAPCGHYYCQHCLTRLFLTSVTDESLFPARCCQLAIPLALVQTLLGPLTSRRVKQRTIEFNDSSRRYCSKPTCSAYIFPGQRKDNCGTCQECNQKTCLLCTEKFHQGRCIQKSDPTLQLALREGWKRCHYCKHLIELDTGCNHIT